MRRIVVLVAVAKIAVAALLGGNHTAHAIPFLPPSDIVIGRPIFSVSSGDVNSDGVPDLALVSRDIAYGRSVLSVIPGTGSGTFGTPIDLPIRPGNQWADAIVGDVNGDGKADLAVTDGAWHSGCGSYDGVVSVLVGDGTGSFGPPSDYCVGANPTASAIGDLDGDGIADIVVVNTYGASVSVLLGTGGGSFGARTDFPTGGGPASIALADLNGDGKLDIVTAGGANAVSVLLGSGTGGFGAKTDFTTGGQPMSVAVGDLNGDGHLDLVTANWADGTVSVLLSTGTGAFGASTDLPSGTESQSVVIGDLNGDGKLDLAVANFFGVSVLLGRGSGDFVAKTDTPTGRGLWEVVGDFNADGRPDLAVAKDGGNSGYSSLNRISILLGAQLDTDSDGCNDAGELLRDPPTDPVNPWDFYSVPVPALFAAANPSGETLDSAVGPGDAQAIFAYFKRSAKAGSAEYEQDLNGNGIADGIEYDRSFIAAGTSGPPDGIISATDAQLAFAQFKMNYKC